MTILLHPGSITSKRWTHYSRDPGYGNPITVISPSLRLTGLWEAENLCLVDEAWHRAFGKAFLTLSVTLAVGTSVCAVSIFSLQGASLRTKSICWDGKIKTELGVLMSSSTLSCWINENGCLVSWLLASRGNLSLLFTPFRYYYKLGFLLFTAKIIQIWLLLISK